MRSNADGCQRIRRRIESMMSWFMVDVFFFRLTDIFDVVSLSLRKGSTGPSRAKIIHVVKHNKS